MAEPDTGEQVDNTTPPPTEEEQETQTVNDNVEEPQEPKEPENTEPDVSARLDALEKELAALKAMLDTLGYEEPDNTDNDVDGGEPSETIEQLFENK